MFKKRFNRVAGAVALATALVVAPAAAAQAVVEYPPADSQVREMPAVRYIPGGTVALDFSAGAFSPFQRISFTLNGYFAQNALVGVMGAEVQTLGHAKTAAADGSLRVTHKLPQNAAGTYNLTAASDGWARTWTFTVGPDGSAATVTSGTSAATGTTSTGNQLAETGSAYDELLWAWVAGGGIALAAGGIVVANSVRKEKKLAA